MTYYTFRKVALAHKAAWQKLRFLAGKGYYLVGKPPKPKPKPAALPFLMFDSVTVSEIPKTASAVAGYVNGLYKTWPKIVVAFPHAKKLSIAVSVSADAECLDVEQGDATPGQAPAWVRRQKARGVRRPVVYCSVSAAPEVLRRLADAGIPRQQIRLWTAHYTNVAHRCSKACGYGGINADATQFTSHYKGRNLDASSCAPDFL